MNRFRASVINAVILSVLLSIGLHSCRKPSAPAKSTGGKAAVLVEETRLAAIPEKLTLRGVDISPNGNISAYYASTPDDKMVMMIGDREAGVYEAVKELRFSPDEKKVAYVVRMKNKEYMMLDGKAIGKGYDTVDNPVFSPDGSIVAYEASEHGKYFVVVGDRESGRYDMSSMPPIFSGDGKHVLYVLQDYASQKVFVFISEVKSGKVIAKKEYDTVGQVVLDDERSRFAFPAIKRGSFHLIQGQFSSGEVREGPELDLIEKPALSPDGLDAAYLFEQKNRRMLMVRGKPVDFSNKQLGYPPVFSKDGKKVAWAVGEGDKRRIYVDGAAGPMYDEVSQPVFSPDGSTVAYGARKGDKFFIVVGDREGPAFDMALPPVFSPDGSRLAYRVRNNNQRFIVLADAMARTVKQFPPYEAVWQPVFTPDGKKLAYGVGTLPVKELWWKVEPVE